MGSSGQGPGAWHAIRLHRTGDLVGDGLAVPSGVAVLQLSCPEPANPVSRGVLAELEAALEVCQADAAIRVLVLTGAPGACGDFATGPAESETVSLDVLDATAYALRGQEVMNKLAATPLPVIAAIGGRCIDAGLELALACDLRVASSDASFAMTWLSRGLMPAFGGAARLLRLAGPGKATQILCGCDTFSCEDAHRSGIIQAVTEPGEHLGGALALASRWAAQPPVVLAAIKETTARSGDLPLDEALRYEAAVFGRLFREKP